MKLKRDFLQNISEFKFNKYETSFMGEETWKNKK